LLFFRVYADQTSIHLSRLASANLRAGNTRHRQNPAGHGAPAQPHPIYRNRPTSLQ